MRKVFLDTEYDKSFREHGFVKIPGFLNAEEISTCNEIFDASPKEGLPTTFHTTHWSKDEGYRRLIHDQLAPVLSQKALPLFNTYRSVYSYFLVKYPGAEGEVTLHQDWSLIEEARHPSVIVWCPLVDVDGTNGAFHIVKGSHKFLDNVRGSNIRPWYDHISKYIAGNYLTEVLVKAGEAILFDQRMLHASPPNRSDKIRIAVGNVMIPEEAKMLHYYVPPEKQEEQIGIYEGDEDFLLTFAFGDTPEKLKRVGVMENDLRKMTPEIFDELYASANS